MKALLSVYDKDNIEDIGTSLRQAGYEIISTGGTYKSLKKAGISVRQISDLTGFPEILDGRVKTLHPKVHGGILARRDITEHREEMESNDISAIDVVVVNLYPFVDTVRKGEVSLAEALENIDIGGPTMIRSAAKNFLHVLVVVDPLDYDWIAERITSGDEITEIERKKLAQKAFQHVAVYDTAISTWLNKAPLESNELSIGLGKVETLRYGENPHQDAAVYRNTLGIGGIVEAEQLHGLPMSYTNYLDADAAWTTAISFDQNACVVVKHTNPCGISLNNEQSLAYESAFQGDSISAYGGIVGFNNVVTRNTAEAMRGVLFDIIVAPGYESDALEILKKRKRTRLLQASRASGALSNLKALTISGGMLVQTIDEIKEDSNDWKVVTERSPTEREFADLEFAWNCLRHIKSNTIVLAKDNTLVGMGAGQPNRVVSVHLALRIAGDKSIGSSLASDAFMPFADNVELAAEGGITAIIQPGGSIRDEEVIKAANEHSITMMFTGIRHFNH
ncbi:bifunctional phosphoribosylaminoimidazolecarboxamide formyltransferase/IMP cyclohydrolase [Chloroflexi bacterium]|nr:bifunctional phosphoribosylaminoimidazolecarboxamide formyltransferase/IMP cyclohydrolase [Chloroflexota bacterium]